MAGNLWGVNTLGGYMYSLNLTTKFRQAVQPLVKFRQFCDAKDSSMMGKNKGDLFTWNVYSDVAVAGTTLTETDTVPETNFTITQGTLTMSEAGNSVGFSEKLDNNSKASVTEVINRVLKQDASKKIDRMAWTAFKSTPLKAIPTAGTDTAAVTVYTNGTVTGTNSLAMNTAHVKSIVDAMKERNIPTYTDEDYFCIARPSTLRTVKNNLETIHQYTETGLVKIMSGEIGRYENTRFIEQTNIVAGNSTDGITGTAWTTGKSDWAFFFGADTVTEGITMEEELRAKIPTDYGRSKGIAWLYVGGFGLVQTAQLNARVVEWASQT